ncbi:hypothetical protein E2C01_008350 [Portunus trituberculatus]|uniref:Apple domain-containing protein n=1 Tax=Portunus trituberculatus TaxID=210409 RepID=A0A5B7D2K9_PORTR|nr:hypothetical protein [Portunus trituberculatus]
MLPFSVAPYLACILALMAPTLAQDIIEDVGQPAPSQPASPDQPFVLGSQPIQPIQPVQPVQPVQPIQPIQPGSLPSIPVLNTNFESTTLEVSSCPPEQINFELVTGYVYSAPADMLDSQPGTLKLTDCIDMCRNNRSCMAVNYETGLCVLFSSNADMYPVKVCVGSRALLER